jgi:tRNA(Ile)-lysidine synthase
MKAFGFLAGKQDSPGVAVSGGSDSMALLVLAAEYAAAQGVSCFAVTVDHGLRPEAASEARHVRRVCGKLGVQHTILRWKREAKEAVGRAVSQDEARQARHRLMATWARRVGVKRLALGHTRDDRLETFLMRARQGSGWHGLAGLMPNGCSPVWPEGRELSLVRPLLAFGREELRDELRARGIAWVEDPSNEASRFERVRMRRLLARMDQGTREKALHVMDGLTRMRAAVSAEASALVSRTQIDAQNETAEIPLTALTAASNESLRRAVEGLIMAAGGAARGPRRDALDRLLQRIAANDPELAGGVTLAGAKIRVRRGVLLSVSQAPARRGMPGPLPPDWDRATRLLEAPDPRVLAV